MSGSAKGSLMQMPAEDWTSYVRRITDGLTQTQIADRIGRGQSHVSRWILGKPGTPTIASVVDLARAFNQPVLDAIVAAGFVEAAEVGLAARTPLSQYTTAELFDELRRRTKG